jgi:flagellar basal-body rod protein FlgB
MPSDDNGDGGTRDLQPIRLFELASQQSQWLSARQAIIAENVSNANTPGYISKDLQAFTEFLDKTNLQMVSTHQGHLGLDPFDSQTFGGHKAPTWEVTQSGNSVGLEQEMIKAGEVNRSFSLNTEIVKAFHGMLMSSVKE